MAFRNLMDSVKNFFGPNNSFFNGPRAEEEAAYNPAPAASDSGYYAQPQQQAAPQQSAQPYAQPAYDPQPQQSAYQASAYQQPYAQPAYQQNAYQQPAYQAQPFQQPQQPVQPQMQQPAYSASPLQQGYQPQQRNRRSAQHAQQPQQPEAENVVPFPGIAQQPQQAQPAAQPQQGAPAKQLSACVVNARSIADCRNAIGILRTGDCVIAVMDSIADQAEVRRYVDTLNGACFSLGCTMTRLSARVGVYLLAPAGMQVYTDRTTTQMNAQSRAPQRANPGMQQSAFQSTFAPQQGQMPYGQAAYQQPVNPFTPPQPVYAQPQQPAFSEQQPSQGYVPDHEGAEYNSAVM